MPTLLRACRGNRCPERTDSPDGLCPACRLQRFRDTERHRGNSCERGYDKDWKKLRAAKVAADPICEECLQQTGRPVPVKEVDHIIPIAIRPDLRLDWANLQSLCIPCHRKKTREDQRKYGVHPRTA